MSASRPKTPKRTTDAKARGRKGRGSRLRLDRLTHHRCEICGKRRLDEWGKVPRMKYGKDGAAHPYCAKHWQEKIA